MAAVSDTLGRVHLIDTSTMSILRIIKGHRVGVDFSFSVFIRDFNSKAFVDDNSICKSDNHYQCQISICLMLV